jgi:Protein of unknown function (DUF1553)/Protein of unknown function (DUF1549)/Planctomycete cytochrome C
MKKYLFLFSFILATFTLGITFYACTESKANSVSNSGTIDYNYHIRPILSDRCFACHGPDANKRKANLRLDTEGGAFAALEDKPKEHVLVKNNPEKSDLYKRIVSKDTSMLMPPPESNLKLTDDEKKLIEKWIKQGAVYKKHWSFIPPIKSELPEADKAWTHNAIDNFAYAKMKEKGLDPAKEATKEALLKRLSFDLTGLPPTLAMQEEYMKDDSPKAYFKMVTKLLSNPHFGEKMALNWLDVARYADSHGYQDDGLRTMWPWRDWVIHAFNSNYSYKKFITWQLAGDLMAKRMPKNIFAKEMTLATGFNRNHKITQEGGVIDEEYRIEYVTDRTNTFGKSMIALTLECAKCHDHKYDPISQKEYYGAFSFFNMVPEKGLYGTIDASFADPPNMKIEDKDVKNIFKFINKKDSSDLFVMVMKDSLNIRPTYILQRGSYDAHGDTVSNTMPKAVKSFIGFEKNRYGLSQWMFADDNPLTARVYVNRIWEQFFGRGIVKTVGDFGMQGELPSHPELLDWLAKDFQENGWNIKRLIAQIVTSATYMQSSNITKNQLETDPDNIYLSRASRLRFQAEIVRDHILATSDLLNTEIGGPSVKTYQPKGLWEVATSGRGSLAAYVQDKGKWLYRRGMYVFIKRTVPPPAMLIFDSSNRDQCEVSRGRTNTPLQALAMLNDPHVLESASYLAYNAEKKQIQNEKAISDAFRRIICRSPTSKELKILTDYFETEKKVFEKDNKKAQAFLKIGEYPRDVIKDTPTYSALFQSILLIYNMEEALIRI